MVSTIIISILQMKKWRLRKIKTFAWDHKDNQQWKEASAFIDLFSESIKKMCMLPAFFLPSIYPSSQPSIHLSIHPLTYSQQVSGSHIISLWWNRVQTQMSKPLPSGLCPGAASLKLSGLSIPLHSWTSAKAPRSLCLRGLYSIKFTISEMKTKKFEIFMYLLIEK